jgi:hypothetical protein
MAILVPDVPATLNLRYPVACQALVDAATSAGTTVVRGVRDVKVTGGRAPTSRKVIRRAIRRQGSLVA